jgi:hypothetical protein
VGLPRLEAHLGSVLRYALAAAFLGAGLIHVSAIFDHLDHPVVVTFFALLAVVQVGWAVAVLRRPTPFLLKVGAVLSAGVVGIWIVSRTTGLPGVPGAEEPEAFGLKDVVASALEVLVVAGVASQLAARAQGLRLASGRLASGLVISAIGVLTAAGLAAPGHGHHHEGADHGHSESRAAGDHAHEEAARGHGSETGPGADHHAAAGAHEHASGSHDLPAGPGGRHDDGHAHEADPGHVHDDGHDHPAPSLAQAAGAAEHDHNAPGHVLDPSHHHAPGHVHDPSHHHPAPEHSDQASGHAEPGHAEPGHGGGNHDEHDTCTNPLPANQAVTAVQEAAQSTLGVGCHIQAFGPTGHPHRHSTLRRSAQHFIS